MVFYRVPDAKKNEKQTDADKIEASGDHANEYATPEVDDEEVK